MTDPELTELLRRAQAHVDAMTPEQLERMRREQRRSYVRGELGMGRDDEETRVVDALAIRLAVEADEQAKSTTQDTGP